MNLDALAVTWSPRLLSILRIMSGLLLLQHGTGKLLKFPAGAVPPTFNLNSMPGYAGFIEFVCGILLIIGLFSRPAAFVASGMTAVAYFMVHAPQGLHPVANKGELAALYCFLFLYMAARGSGRYSVDASRTRS
jgi:putative oxidoreductase